MKICVNVHNKREGDPLTGGFQCRIIRKNREALNKMAFWDRTVLKARAKLVLRQRYWPTFAAVLVAGLLGGTAGAPTANFRININLGSDLPPEMILQNAPLIFSVTGAVMLLGIAYSIFVAGPAEVGLCRYLWRNQQEAPPFETLFSGFKKNYSNTVRTILLRNVYVLLWTFLFIIPGIIKCYAYFMVPYLLAENPDMPAERAFDISKRTTDGEKGEMWVLTLSFIGWILLTVLTCGIGYLFLKPYIQTTYAELYGALRYKAIATGICTEAELQAR